MHASADNHLGLHFCSKDHHQGIAGLHSLRHLVSIPQKWSEWMKVPIGSSLLELEKRIFMGFRSVHSNFEVKWAWKQLTIGSGSILSGGS
jgi:hypothetical protein